MHADVPPITTPAPAANVQRLEQTPGFHLALAAALANQRRVATAVLHRGSVSAADFEPAYLAKVSLANINTVLQVIQGYGALRELSPADELNGRYVARYATAAVAVQIALSPRGRISAFSLRPVPGV
jgi:hypothetical protein